MNGRFRVLWVCCSVLSGLALVPLYAADTSITADTPVNELWTMMRTAGMINDEQLAHALATGSLAEGAVVQNSPVPAEKQASWTKLHDNKVITAQELAYLFFKGQIPDMTAEENKAFEELAKVYEPDRKRRLTYAVRLAHQKVELIRLSKRSSKDWKQKHDEAIARATKEDMPIKGEGDNGSIFELHRYDHDMPLYKITFNRISAQTIATDKARPGGSSPFNLTGTNVTVAMWDGGAVWTTHQEFATARVTDMDNSTVIDHSTMVAGTMAAQGVDTNAQGMAYAVNVLSFDWNFTIAEMSSMVASNPNVHVSNHSYGLAAGWDNINLFWWAPRWWGDTRLSEDEDNHFGWYSADSADMDEFCYTAPYHLPVFAAGNDRQETHGIWYEYPLHGIKDYVSGSWVNSSRVRPPDGGTNGYDCISSMNLSKNILTVGAVVDIPGGETNASQVNLDWYSGTGPTDDGRIKPDLVANGQGLHTTTAATNNMGYADPSGTSFSSPSVAGSLALLQELHERFYGTNAPMLASTLKGLVLHTADDAGNIGPDYRNGWGLMNTERAGWVITNNAAWNSMPHIKEVSLANGSMIQFGILGDTGTPLKVTICWTDPAGTEQPWALDPTNLTLVNDLDLRVISPDGITTNFPWVLDPVHPEVAATNGDNICDNVEQVSIPQPTNGYYTVAITHKGTLSNGVQDVSIIITGNTPTNAPDFVITSMGALGDSENPSETNGWVQLTWPGVVGALYQMEACTNLLESESWTNHENVISANLEAMQYTDTNAPLDTLRFYRIKRLK